MVGGGKRLGVVLHDRCHAEEIHRVAVGELVEFSVGSFPTRTASSGTTGAHPGVPQTAGQRPLSKAIDVAAQIGKGHIWNDPWDVVVDGKRRPSMHTHTLGKDRHNHPVSRAVEA